jgi:hypothetical protein
LAQVVQVVVLEVQQEQRVQILYFLLLQRQLAAVVVGIQLVVLVALVVAVDHQRVVRVQQAKETQGAILLVKLPVAAAVRVQLVAMV